jgi:cytochrome c5
VNQADKKFLTQFAIVLAALVAFTVIIFFIARFLMSANSKEENAFLQQYEDERLKPVGEVSTGKVAQTEPKAASGTGNITQASGQQTYSQACSTCHDTGSMGAPKITDTAAWQSRIKKGKQTLYEHAINGFGAMPPKGGQASLSEVQVKAAVDYIVTQVSGGGGTGKQQAAGGGKVAQEAQPTKAQAVPREKLAGIKHITAKGSSAEGKSVYNIMCSTCHDSGVLGAPKVTDKDAWEARIAKGPQALYNGAINGVGAMPAKGGNPQLSNQEVKVAVDYIISRISGAGANSK